MSGGDVLTGIGIGVAIATSIASLVISLFVVSRDRHHLRVATSFAYLTPGMQGPYVRIEVANDGRYAEVVSSVGFFTNDRKQMFLIQNENFPEGPPPKRLEPGDGWTAMVEETVLRDQWRNEQLGSLTQTFVNTRSGRSYRGEVPSAIRSGIEKGGGAR